MNKVFIFIVFLFLFSCYNTTITSTTTTTIIPADYDLFIPSFEFDFTLKDNNICEVSNDEFVLEPEYKKSYVYGTISWGNKGNKEVDIAKINIYLCDLSNDTNEFLKSFSYTHLPPMMNVSTQYTLEANVFKTKGMYKIKAIIDESDDYSEYSEDNNCEYLKKYYNGVEIIFQVE